ncbi:MAG: glycoside hydrolase family 38 C-terminal domain-containing protein, partial [Planctomycetota bacterium]
MVDRTRLAALRALSLVDEVLGPAIHPQRTELAVEILAAEGRRTLGEAQAARGWRSFERGDVFGPPWARVWFRLRGAAPRVESPLWLNFVCGTEALVRRPDGRPWHGLDENRPWIPLPPELETGASFELLIEARCNRPLGSTTFFFDAPETRGRWASGKPGRLDAAALGGFDPSARRLAVALRAAAELVESLGVQSTRAKELMLALEAARFPEAALAHAREHEGALPAEAIARSLEVLLPTLSRGTAPSATRCFPVGHAHLDTAWLWDTSVTREKLVRTASTALRTLESVPSFHFLCTQPQQYAWLEADEPALFEEVKSAVESGRWEPLGATWIEPDGNLPSGESFCRQLIEGVRHMGERFGDHGRQRLLYLPDSFGFAGSLPQLAALAGLDTFVTNKLWWSETTEFPFANFRWRGIDGTELLAHLTPGQDYNATLHVEDLRRGERVLAERDEAGVTAWLQPYGFGDGGGGPTPEQAERAALLSACEGLPKVEPAGARTFCEGLHAQARAAAERGTPLPVHDGELYLELHRGTWTTQAALKRGNATLEAALRREEALAVLTDDPARTARARELWREVLLNQFHDILPGSGTREVIEEAQDRYRRVAAALEAERTSGTEERHFNALSRTDGDAAPLGLGSVRRVSDGGASLDGLVLENPHLRAEFDELGRLVSLARPGSPAPDVGSRERPLLDFRLHEDRPRRWEAWDIDEESLLRFDPVAGARSTIEPLDTGTGLRITHPLESGSRIEVLATFDDSARGLRLDVTVDWREDRRLLRAAFPTGLRAAHWTASVPFGHLERATTRNTPGERARFEMSIHRWIDLSEPGRGLSLVTDCVYGGACLDDELALSLLRATRFPDPVGDSAPGGSRHTFR